MADGVADGRGLDASLVPGADGVLTDRWHGDTEGLRAADEAVREAWASAWATDDPADSATCVGEGASMTEHAAPGEASRSRPW